LRLSEKTVSVATEPELWLASCARTTKEKP